MKLLIIAILALISNIAFAGNEGIVQPNCPDGKKIEGASCPIPNASPGNLFSSVGTLTRDSTVKPTAGAK